MTNITHISEESMLKTGQATKEMIQLMKMFAQSNVNTIIGGNCGSGKSELLGWYLGELNRNQRIVISDPHSQLRLDTRYPDKFFATLSNHLSLNDKTTLEYLLEMKPDYFILDELRSPKETAFFNDLSLFDHRTAATTCGTTVANVLDHLHSNLMRINASGNETLSHEACGKLIADSIDIIALQKQLPDGLRTIAEIAEVIGFKDNEYIINTIFKLKADGITKGKMIHKQVGVISERLANTMKRAGVSMDDSRFSNNC